MNENRYFTTAPIIGRLLAQYGWDSLQDSHGNRATAHDGIWTPSKWQLTCADGQGDRWLSDDDRLLHDKLVLKASSNDLLGAAMDEIDRGTMESPLKTLCDKGNDTDTAKSAPR